MREVSLILIWSGGGNRLKMNLEFNRNVKLRLRFGRKYEMSMNIRRLR